MATEQVDATSSAVEKDKVEDNSKEESVDSNPDHKRKRSIAEDLKDALAPAVSGGRVRKAVSTFTIEEKEDKGIEIPSGNGTSLNDLGLEESVKSHSANSEELRALHLFLFGRCNKKMAIKNNILQFNGFEFEGEVEEDFRDKYLLKASKWQSGFLKSLMDILMLDRSAKSFKDGKADKENLIMRFVDFIICPDQSNIKGTQPAKKAKKSISKKSKETKKTNKKTASTKSSKKDDDSSSSKKTASTKSSKKDDDSSSSKKTASKKTAGTKRKSSGGLFSASSNMFSKGKGQNDGDVNTPPKKTASKKKSSSRQPKKPVVEADDDDDNEMDDPDDGISSDDIKLAVNDIIKVSDILTLTMKSIKKSLRSKFGEELQLTDSRKAIIKDLIQDALPE